MAHHLCYVRRLDFDIAVVAGRADRLSVCSCEFGLANHAFPKHIPEPRTAPLDGAHGTAQGIAGRRAGQQGDHHRRLGESEFARLLTIVDKGRSADAIRARAEVNRVEVKGEDFFFA